MMPKNSLLTLLFSFIPGAGQMYQGYMKRGLCLVTLFFLFILPGAFLWGLQPLMICCAIVYMYSFFDSLNLHAQIRAGNPPADDFIFGTSLLSALSQGVLRQYNRIIGWGLVLLGGYVVYNTVLVNMLSDLFYALNLDFGPVRQILYALPSLIVAIIFIYAGIRLVQGGGKSSGKPPQDTSDDYTEFKGE